MSSANPLSLLDELRLTGGNLRDYAASAVTPTFRLGVTGLAQSGKTVFITALVNALLRGGRLPLFEPLASGRIARAYIDTQPDDTCPRFPFERNEALLTGETPAWPQSTSQISQIRVTVDFTPLHGWGPFARNRLHIDIVDYPGEWLLDLPLLTRSYEAWCRESWKRANGTAHADLARDWLQLADRTDPATAFAETRAEALAEAFKTYLRAGRERRFALSTLPPGRFLMPGDMAGSPALTFSPLRPPQGKPPGRGSLWAEMERRFEAYKHHIVRPFFRDQFARLDAQIVLVDMLSALNAGPEAMDDLQAALSSILACFRFGRPAWYAAPFRKTISRVVFAATKADHLHSRQHDAYESLLRELVDESAKHAGARGAEYSFVALSALRATWETQVRQGGLNLPCVAGRPQAGETLGGQSFDGQSEVAVFPGELPRSLKDEAGNWNSFTGLRSSAQGETDYRFLRFSPPRLAPGQPWPHIRLDKTLEILLAEALQ